MLRRVEPGGLPRRHCRGHGARRDAGGSIVADVAVIIACRNGADTLRDTLEGLADQSFDQPWEVVLADNGSTDNSVALFEAFATAHPAIAMRVLDCSERAGQPFALNKAIRDTKATRILLYDADDRMAPGYLATLAHALETADFVGAGVEFARLNQGWVYDYKVGTGVPEFRQLPVATHPPYLPYIGSSSMGFTRALFDTVGGFDESFPICFDGEFSFAAQRHGYTITFLPDATMHYRFRDDPRAIRRQWYNYSFWSVRAARDNAGGAPWRGHWKPFLRGWIGTARLGVRTLLRASNDPAKRAALAEALGWHMGQTAGILRFRAPPTLR